MALSADTVQTLALLWVFTWLAMFLMAARLLMRKIRGQMWDLSDKITMVCMVCLLARLAFVHVVLIWGTNNIPARVRVGKVFSGKEIYQRETGSKLIITSRTWYNTYLWLQKAVVMILYQRILSSMQHNKIIMNAYWTTLAITYIIIQVVTFTDCKPLKLYWQVVPDPGTCSQAVGQLVTVGALNIFTDVILIILPMPTLFKIKRSSGAKLRVMFLFSLGVFLVIITIIRLPINIKESSLQVNRTTWASVESFTAAFVANVPTLYALRKALPQKPAEVEKGTMDSGWTEKHRNSSVNSSDGGNSSASLHEHEPTKHALEKKLMPVEERRRAMLLPPPVPPKDDVVPMKRAYIRAGKLEYISEEPIEDTSNNYKTEIIDWDAEEQREDILRSYRL